MRHLDELRVVQEKSNVVARELVPRGEYQLLRQDFANAIDRLHRMLQVVRKFAEMRHTELVSQISDY